jgi:hypothetical protein
MLVGGGHKERRWSMVDGEEWRRPWRRKDGARTSIGELQGCGFGTYFGRRWGGRGSSTLRGSRAAPVAAAARDSLDSG